MVDLVQQSGPGSVPPPSGDPEQTRIADVRGALDRAMRLLREIDDRAIDAAAIESALGEALQHVYVAMAARGDWGSFRGASAASVPRVQHALALLMAVPSEDPAVDEIARL